MKRSITIEFGTDVFTCNELFIDDKSSVEIKRGRKLIGTIRNLKLPESDPTLIKAFNITIENFLDLNYY